jgi:hypothetical protein
LPRAPGHEFADILEFRASRSMVTTLVLTVLGDARGVAHGAEDQFGLALVVGNDAPLTS